jgi:hypothetical protein
MGARIDLREKHKEARFRLRLRLRVITVLLFCTVETPALSGVVNASMTDISREESYSPQPTFQTLT